MATIIYTLTDEAPMLATYSFLPIVQAYARTAGVDVETRDISLAGRIISQFPERLTDEQRQGDALAELGALAKTPEANIIKLPNISASMPQLKAAVRELQGQGYDLPEYPDSPSTDEERDVKARYDKVKGSAVNPVLREGNSDRRAPLSVKNYARKHPHRMGAWTAESRTNVATMGVDDFRSNEKTVVLPADDVLRIEHVGADGSTTVLRESIPVLAGEVVDGTVLHVAALHEFLAAQIARAEAEGVLFSVHLKATMMKISDPILFGHVIRAFFPQVFEKYGDDLRAAGLDPANGLNGDPAGARLAAERRRDPRGLRPGHRRRARPRHGRLRQGHDQPARAVRRDRRRLDARDDPHLGPHVGPRRRGARHARGHPRLELRRHLPGRARRLPRERRLRPRDDGLRAERRPHGAGRRGVRLARQDLRDPRRRHRPRAEQAGDVLIEHEVATGDIWRACQTKDVPIRDWVKLAVTRARASGTPAVFWLDETRAHDATLIGLVRGYLAEHDTEGLQIEILSPVDAMAFSLERIRRGEDTISVTGNVLRDYLTDLFPIMELGTSAKMLSVVPLINGGGLFETGAGGSAPKHVQQLVDQDYLRWDSLGEFLALAVSFEHLATSTGNARAQVLADTLDRATGTFLDENKSPGRKLGSIDNRGSHFFLAKYWADELATQTDDAELASAFASLAATLGGQEETIVSELIAPQGTAVEIGGYYHPDAAATEAVMRPSATLNAALATL